MTDDARTSTPALPDGFSTQSLVPVLLFVVINRVGGLRWAVVVATVWSVFVLVDRRRKGLPLGRFIPVITAAVLIRGAIGAITGSDALYFGMGIATKYAAAAILLGSVVLGRPLARLAAPYLMVIPGKMAQNPLFHSTMSAITVIGGCYYAVSASFDIWLFRRSTVEGFVLLRFLANWPLGAITIVAIMTVAKRRLQRIPGVPPVATLVEQRLGTQRDTPNAETSPNEP